MADNPEISQWEPGIYELATTDQVLGGTGGVSNRPNVELGNRTARIKSALDEQGIFVDPTEHQFWGANVDPTAVFEGTVTDGDVVWYDKTQNRYENALAESGGGSAATNTVAGIADVTNGRVINSGLILLTTTQTFTQGDLVYLSGVLWGATTTAVSSAVVGRVLWLESPSVVVLNLNNANMIARHSDIYDDEPSLHFTEASIDHSNINDDEPTKHYLVGNILHSAINDNEASKHRLINDAGVSTTQLWSSDKINDAINEAGGAHSPGASIFSRWSMRYGFDNGLSHRKHNINTGAFNPPTGPGQTSYRFDNGTAPGYFLQSAYTASQWTVYYNLVDSTVYNPDWYTQIYLTAASPRYICLQGTLLNNANNTNAGVRLMMGPAGSGGTGSGNVLSTIGGPYGNLNYGAGTCGVRGHSSAADYAYSFAIFLDTNSLAHNQFYSFNVQVFRESGSNPFFSYMKCYWTSTAATLSPYHTPL